MKVGVLKEIKTNENRVSLLPAGVELLKQNGHEVIVETQAGVASTFPDALYEESGAIILPSAKDVYERVDMVMKVKEPLPQEYDLIREGQIVFTYFHFAASEELTLAMVKSKCVAIAYETIEDADSHLPLLTPMSEVAGRLSIQAGARFLERAQGGMGILLGGVPGVGPATVVILGGGVVGTNAAQMAAGMGVTVVWEVAKKIIGHHPWQVPAVYPALVISVLILVLVSLAGSPPSKEKWSRFVTR